MAYASLRPHHACAHRADARDLATGPATAQSRASLRTGHVPCPMRVPQASEHSPWTPTRWVHAPCVRSFGIDGLVVRGSWQYTWAAAGSYLTLCCRSHMPTGHLQLQPVSIRSCACRCSIVMALQGWPRCTANHKVLQCLTIQMPDLHQDYKAACSPPDQKAEPLTCSAVPQT